MKTIPISPRNGEVSQETVSGSPGKEFSGVREGLLAAGVTAWRNNVFASTQVGVYFRSPEGQIVDSGWNAASGRLLHGRIYLPK
jgi:hypothetical protein